MESIQITILDVGIIVAYFIGIIFLGMWVGRRKINTGEDLFLAGRETTWPVVGASLFGTNISSQQFVGQAGLAFSVGIVAGAFQLVGAMCFAFLALFFLDAYIGLKLSTSPEFFERRFGPGSRMFVSGINILMIVSANIAASLYAGGTVMTDFLGWHTNQLFWMAVIILAITTGVYTILGGLRSVLWTTYPQTFILLLAGLLTLVFGVIKAGGLSEILALSDAEQRSMWSVVRPWDHAFGWLPFMTGVFVLGVHGHCTDHDYIQRCLAAKNLYHAKMGALFASFLKISALFLIAAPGVVAAKLFPDLANGDMAYSRMVRELMPIGLTGIVLAGLLSAIMSSIAAGLSATASLLNYDFILKVFPRMKDRTMVRLGRFLMFFVLVLCTIWAPFIRGFEGLFKYLLQIWSLIAPPVFVTVVFGLFYHKANAKGAITTLAVGSILGAFAFMLINMTLLADLKNSLHPYLQNPLNHGFIITIICTVVLFVVSRATGSTPEDLAKAESIRQSKSMEKMNDDETRKYRFTLYLFFIVWLIILIMFSPLGLGR